MTRRHRPSWFAGTLLLLLPAAALAQPFVLGVKYDLSVVGQPTAVVITDINGDGKGDLVAANASGYVAVRLGDGAASFGPAMTYPTGVWESALVVGDLNGDGKPDMAVTNYTTLGTVSVFLGDGAGGFGPKTDFPVGKSPAAIAMGDLNGDGIPDLAAADAGSASVSVLLGNGAGGFGPKTDLAVGFQPFGVAIGDLNGDGNADLAVACVNNFAISVLFGNGDGGFAPRTDVVTGGNPFVVAIADLNGDGKQDLVATDYSANAVTVLLGNGSGGFGAPANYTTGLSPRSLAIADLNGDGIADVAVADETGNSASILIGDGAGGFGPKLDITAETQPFGVAIGDVNGDGKPDIAVANFATATKSVTLMLNNGPGGFAARTDYPTLTTPRWAALADFNLDGKPDLAIANTGAASASVRLGDGAGGFGPRADFATGSSPNCVAAGDVSGDGKPDLLVANYSNFSNSVSVWLGNGAGSFTTRTDYAVGLQPQSIALGDFNGDGKPDMIVANGNSNSVTYRPGDGAGGFGARGDFSTGSNPISVAVGDLDRDGRLDVATANYYANTVSVLLGNGNGTFATKVDYACGNVPGSVAIGDLNGDGNPDLVVANSGDNTVSVLLGTGSGAFGGKTDFPVGAGDFTAAIGDVNGDGRPDIVTANFSANTVSVVLGNGSGGFGAPTDYPTAGGTDCVLIADVNGDGRPDITATNYYANTVSELLALEATRTSLSVSPSPAVLGGLLTLTARVSVPAPGSGSPTGSVRFFDGTTLLGTAPVNGGVAALALFAPRLGARTYSAVYIGDSKALGSISPNRSGRVVASASPSLASIRDVSNDQGGQVRVRFRASPFDLLGSGTPITQYELYRQITPVLMTSLVAPDGPAGEAAPSRTSTGSAALASWDFVGSLAAHGDSAYVLLAPTLADSNGTGIHRAVFMVRATTAAPSVYFDSAPDSGYSVDNLPPAPPAPFVATYAAGVTHLHWGAGAEPDLEGYRIYRGNSMDFVPGPANLIAAPSDTGYSDAAAPGGFYKLSAVDVNGNESGYAVLGPDGTLSVSGGGRLEFALEGARPNPSHGPGLLVTFSLREAGPAKLELLDVIGRRLSLRDLGSFGPGRHSLDLAEGRSLAAGVYLVRLTQAGSVRSTRVAVVP